MEIVHTVADGVHCLTHANTNCYLVEAGDDLLLVDAGLPSMWPLLGQALTRLGRGPGDLRAVLLTHGHFDHLGFALRLQQKHQVPVFVHPADSRLAAHPYRYRPRRNRVGYLVTHPGGWRPIGQMAAAGALTVRGVKQTLPLQAGPLDLPGRPVAVLTPGHTAGHCAFLLADRDVLLCGDALVTLDPYTGQEGPQIVADGATADPDQALGSLAALARTGVATLLTGHGEPWRQGAAQAVRLARAVGEH